jgi:hypothetical protein
MLLFDTSTCIQAVISVPIYVLPPLYPNEDTMIYGDSKSKLIPTATITILTHV